MVWYLVFQRQAAEPAVSEIVVDVFAELPFRRDAVEVSHQLHPEVHFRVDRRTAQTVGITGGRQLPHEPCIQDAIDLAQKMVLFDKRLQVDDGLRVPIEDMDSLHGATRSEGRLPIRPERPTPSETKKPLFRSNLMPARNC